MTYSRQFTLDDGTPVTVDYTYRAGFGGSRYEPPEGPEVEIKATRAADGRTAPLTDAEHERIWTTIAENHEADHLASWADDLRDRQRDEAMMEEMAERRAKE